MPILTLTDPVNGTVTDAELIANNNHAIIATVNGLTNENIDPGAAISISKLAAYPSDGTKTLLGDGTWGVPPSLPGVPTGAMMMWPAAAAPAGWHLCDGFSAVRTDPVYAALFAVIGLTYGSADGTHFSLPNCQDRVPVGKGATFPTLAAVGGEVTHVLTTAELATHAHTASASSSTSTGVTIPDHAHAFLDGFGSTAFSAFAATPSSGSAGSGAGDRSVINISNTQSASLSASASSSTSTSVTVDNNGSGTAHNNMQPYLIVNYIIKL